MVRKPRRGWLARAAGLLIAVGALVPSEIAHAQSVGCASIQGGRLDYTFAITNGANTTDGSASRPAPQGAGTSVNFAQNERISYRMVVTSTEGQLSGTVRMRDATTLTNSVVLTSSGDGTYTGYTDAAADTNNFTILFGTPGGSGSDGTIVFEAWCATQLATTQAQASVTGMVGMALSAAPVTASGGAPGYSFALTGGTLPAGLTFNTATGAITGTPTATLAATTFTVTVTDSTQIQPQTSFKTFQLAVDPLPLPTVTGVSPNFGPGSATTAGVTVTGTNFTAGSTVQFGSVAGTSVVVNSPTSLTVTAPSQAFSVSPVDVRVTNPTGQSPVNAPADQFHYLRAPGPLASFAPSTIASGEVSTLTVQLTSSSGIPIAGVGFSKTLTNVTIAATPNVTTSNCGASPSVTAVAGTSLFQLSGAQLAASGVCTVTVDVTSTTPGAHSTGTFLVTATSAQSIDTGGATLTVNPPVPVLTGFTASAVGFQSTGNTIDVLAGTGATNSPTGWEIAASSGGTFGAAAASAEGGTVTIDSSGSVTYGAPAGFHGADSFFVRASNAGGTSNVVQVDLSVDDPSLSITMSGGGRRGVDLTTAPAVVIDVSGGSGNYSCTLVSGTLPTGVDLESDCTFSGIATVAGTSNFAVLVTDALTGPGGAASPYNQGTPLQLVITQQVPTITGISPSSGTTAGGTTITITGTDLDNASAVQIGTLPGTDILVDSPTQIRARTQGQAAGPVDVTVTTPGGLSAPATFTFVAPPAAPVVVAPADGALLTTTTPGYSGTAVAGASVEVFVDSGSVGTVTATGGAWSLTPAAPLADGSHQVKAIATVAGIVSADSAVNSFTVDATAPAAPVVTAPADGTRSNVNTPTVSGTAEAGSTVIVSIGATVLPGVTASGGGTFTATAGSAIVDGTYDITATATDAAGNVSPASAPVRLTIDTVAPSAPVVTAPADGAITGATPTVSGTAEANATVDVSIGGAAAGTTTADGGGAWSLVASAQTPGSKSVTATATDAAGNVSPPSAAIGITVAGTPLVTSISPSEGPEEGGISVTIAGAGLLGASAVDFGGTSAVVTAVSATAITATVPPGSGTVDVTVTTPGGTSVPDAASRFTYIPAPTVIAVAPSVGPVSGGSPVTITGTGFTGATAVSFNGAPASGVGVVNATTITATTPPGTAGAAEVRVSGPGGTSAAASVFTYIGPPVAADLTGVVVPFNTVTPIDLSTSITGSHASIAIGTAPAHGTVSIAGDLVTYTPAAGYAGPDSFTYTASGIGGASAPATVSLEVAQGAQTISFAALPDASLSASPLTLSASASSGLTVAFTVSTPTVCTVSGTALTLVQTGTCTVDADQPGDAIWAAAPTVSRSFTVTPANLVVTAGPVSGATVGASYSQANPATGGTPPYSFAVASGALPDGTTLDAATGTVSGTPATAGAFSYAIGVTDSQGTPASATGATVAGTIALGSQTISFTSSPPGAVQVGSAPYALAATATSGLPVTFALDASSTGCTLAGGTVSFPATGTCVILANQAGNANWNPAAQVQQSFPVGPAAMLDASVSFSPDPIVVGAQGMVTIAFTNANANASPAFATRITADAALFTRAGAPGGTCTGYGSGTPAAGVVEFSGLSVPAGGCTITLGYEAVAAGSGAFVLDGFTPAGFPATPGASSGAVAARPAVTGIAPASGPAGMSVTIAGTGFSTTAANNLVRFGATAATVTAASSTALTVTVPPGSGTVDVTVTVAGQTGEPSAAARFTYIPAPVAADLTGVAVTYETATPIDLSASIAGVHTSIAIGTAPAHGTVGIAGDVVTYTPAAGYFGADSFTYTATGPGGTSPPATVSLTVAAPPAPVAADRDGVDIPYNGAGTAIDLSASIAGLHTSIAIATAPAHGTATVAGDVVTYVPAADYFGADSFTYTATGPGGTSAPATVSLLVATPPPPQADSGSETVEGRASRDAPGSVDIDLSALVSGTYDSIRVETPPAHGTVTLRGNPSAGANGSGRAAAAVPMVVATYTPEPGFAGTDSFTFVAVGPGGTSAPGTVSIQVIGAVPVAQDKTAETGDGQTVSVMLTEGAAEGPFTAATIVSIAPADAATATIVESGSDAARSYRLDVTPGNRFGGAVVVTYTLSNAFGPSAPASVTVTVTARPDPRSDPNVRGISDAQAEATRRFARAQVANFMRRTEQLHGGGGAGSAMGVSLASRDGTVPLRARPADDGWALAITERMRRSGEDPAIGRYVNDPQAPLSRIDAFGSGRTLAADARGVAAPRGAADDAPAPGDDEAGSGTRRIGSLALWSGGAIDIGTRDATTDRTKITATTAGLSAGLDIKLAEGMFLGLGGGYGNDLSRLGTEAQVRGKSTLYAAYASVSPVDGLFLDAMLGRGDLDFATRRLVAAVNGTAIGSRDGDFTVGAVALGIDRGGGDLQWSLYGRGEFLDADLGGYAESGAGRFDLRFDPRALRSVTGTLGGRIAYRQVFGFGSVTPRLRAEWNHEFADADAQWLDYADIPGSAIYALDTSGWTREQFQLSLGTRFDLLKGGWSFDVETGLRGGSGERAGTLQVRISKGF